MSTDYGIEWAYGEFRIARLKGGAVVESWTSPEPVTDLASLNHAMQEACHHIDVTRGGTVAIAYEDDQHTHDFLELPPMSKSDLRKFVGRHVEKEKPFDGPATFRYHSLVESKNRQSGVLLHLLPSHIVEAVMRICEDYYLTPKLLVPLTEVMAEYVRAKQREEDDALLLIALFQDRTQMVIASSSGDVLFVRELSYAWSTANEQRLVTDINRTIGYARQRIGTRIGGAWLLGSLASDARAEFGKKIDTTLSHDSDTAKPDFWMLQVASLPARLDSNFIPVMARSVLSHRTALRTAVGMAAVTWVAAIGFSAVVEFHIRKHLNDRDSVTADIARIEQELAAKDAQIASINQQEDQLSALNVDAFNLPALFLSHLGDLVPEGLLLRAANVTQTDDGWEISLNGESDLSLPEVAPQLMALQIMLQESPWNARITKSWEESWMQQLDSGSAVADGAVGFDIEGRFE
ncbi:MAG: hypothetical protein AAF610_13975 [Pseudomonadota bacterium]